MQTEISTIFLVRHGENLANITREFSYKKTDYNLTERGVRQAEQTARYFAALHAEQPIDAIYTSPLKRAVETAHIVGAATGHDLGVIEELREINCGAFDGVPPTDEMWEHHDRILKSWRNGDPDARFPDGEDFHELRARARRSLATAVSGPPGRRVIVVAHGGIIGASLTDLCPELDHDLVWRVPNRNCAVTEVAVYNGHADDGFVSAWGVMKRWADCGHLSD